MNQVTSTVMNSLAMTDACCSFFGKQKGSIQILLVGFQQCATVSIFSVSVVKSRSDGANQEDYTV